MSISGTQIVDRSFTESIEIDNSSASSESSHDHEHPSDASPNTRDPENVDDGCHASSKSIDESSHASSIISDDSSGLSDNSPVFRDSQSARCRRMNIYRPEVWIESVLYTRKTRKDDFDLVDLTVTDQTLNNYNLQNLCNDANTQKKRCTGRGVTSPIATRPDALQEYINSLATSSSGNYYGLKLHANEGDSMGHGTSMPSPLIIMTTCAMVAFKGCPTLETPLEEWSNRLFGKEKKTVYWLKNYTDDACESAHVDIECFYRFYYVNQQLTSGGVTLGIHLLCQSARYREQTFVVSANLLHNACLFDSTGTVGLDNFTLAFNLPVRPDVNKHEIIILPLNIANRHWVLGVIWVKTFTVTILDSTSPSVNSDHDLYRYLVIFAASLRASTPDDLSVSEVSKWAVDPLYHRIPYPQQMMGSTNCGVAVMIAASMIAHYHHDQAIMKPGINKNSTPRCKIDNSYTADTFMNNVRSVVIDGFIRKAMMIHDNSSTPKTRGKIYL